MSARLVALTGATGFLGRHTALALAEKGFRLRILARRDPAHPLWRDLPFEAVEGGLENAGVLARLLTGADVAVHLAGLVAARSRRAFLAVNRDGAARVAETLRRVSPQAHLIGVSSLAAREPALSAYAESKRAGEVAMAEAFAGGRLTILRPPAVYGPWDRAMLGLFRAAARPVVPVPGCARARITLIHVHDAAAAIAALADQDAASAGATYALADPNPAGYAPREILATAAAAQGNIPRFVPLPAGVLLAAGGAASLWTWLGGRPGVFSVGKAREVLHPDWSVSPGELLPGATARPAIGLAAGFAAAVAWYREAGWLR